jgi:hypothetical protein
MSALVPSSGQFAASQSGMSYKFQRLREKIRRAIESGELNGKLPGERALARRFHVNAKTLSKALTDLAAEGILDRSIGRGTYVRGTTPAAQVAGKWLVLSEDGDANTCMIEGLRAACPELKSVASVADLRPSFLNQFSAVVNLCPSTPDTFLRDLLVRNIPVITVNHEPKTYSMHTVQMDIALGVSRLGRDLILGGHRRLGAVERRGSHAVALALRQAAARYAPDIVVEAAEAAEIGALLQGGATALVCGSIDDARKVRATLAERHVSVPGQLSVTCVGCTCPDADCSGYFVECQKIAEAVIALLKDIPPRPVTLWLPGTWIDRGTLAPAAANVGTAESVSYHITGAAPYVPPG